MLRSLKRDELHARLQRRMYREHNVYLDLANVRRLMAKAFDEIARELTRGRRAGASVEIRGFGTFHVKQRPARRYARPGDGAAVVAPSCRRLVFYPAAALRKDLGWPGKGFASPC